MPDEYRISELDSAASLADTDSVEISKSQQGGWISLKTTFGALAQWVAKTFTFPADLQTESKTIVGAINEAASSGGSEVEITPTLQSGTKVADFEIDGDSGAIYIPDIAETIKELKTPTDAVITDGVAEFETIEENYVKSLTAEITPIQSGSGTPSPSNIRPISGHTEEVITLKDGDGVTQDTETVSFGQTVYGGTLDVTRGVLTIEWVAEDMGTMSYTYANSAFRHDAPSGIISGDVGTDAKDSICSIYPLQSETVIGINYLEDKQYAKTQTNSASRYYFKDSGFTTVADFQTAMAGQTFVYKLATPQTIQLTPTQVKAILGQNNISASTGDITECKYTALLTFDDIQNLIS